MMSASTLILRRFLRAMSGSNKPLFQPLFEDKSDDSSLHVEKLLKTPSLKLDSRVEKLITEGDLKAKHHSGLRNHRIVDFPEEMQAAVFSLIGKYRLEDIKKAASFFSHNLMSRLPPADTEELRYKAADIESRLRSKIDIGSNNPTQEEVEFYEEKVKRLLYAKLRKTFYHWKPIEYDAYNCILYLYSRFAPEYSVLTKVFSEIKLKDSSFKPEYILDVGAGVGSVLWAIQPVWEDSVRVALCVDPSIDMHKIAKLLMQGGKLGGKSNFTGIFFKPVMPYGEENKYDLVTCAYSLLEFESKEERLKLYESMLSKTRKYAVIVENATRGGFKLVLEARDYFLSQENVRIVAPCPHSHSCPRLKSQEMRPVCSFSTKYSALRLVTQKQMIASEKYSYLIIEKTTDSEKVSEDCQWPRVLHSAPRPRHVHVHSCCPDGEIRQMALTKNKHGKHLYKCASYCRNGDLLPCSMEFPDSDSSE